MKTFRTLTLSSVLFLIIAFSFSCSKKDVIPAKAITSEVQTGFADPVDPIIVLVREPWLLGTVRITAPTTININTPFSIVEEVTCGRITSYNVCYTKLLRLPVYNHFLSS